MKIYILTPVYATQTQGAGATPVVHYFAKEWVKLGHEVHVLYLRARYPNIFYWGAKYMSKFLTSLLNQPIHEEPSSDNTYEIDGVRVSQISMKKFLPHSKYSNKVIETTLKLIKDYCLMNGEPEIFVGHWHNPQLEILSQLKRTLGVKTCLVLHNNIFNFNKFYGSQYFELIQDIDILGFRNNIAMKRYCEEYGTHKNMFVASSGVSKNFISAGSEFSPDFTNGIKKFIYVGMLMARKYPTNILVALNNINDKSDKQLIYVGDGDEATAIKRIQKEAGCTTNVIFTGRIPRDQIIEKLKDSQVFIMISKGEVFGLVYLEAMALGLITIGSRNEGIDGIIEDGKNGFLCDAGNTKELEQIIERIQNMPYNELIEISQNAKLTAMEYSDGNVASSYLSHIM